jgi:hypothetical protein
MKDAATLSRICAFSSTKAPAIHRKGHAVASAKKKLRHRQESRRQWLDARNAEHRWQWQDPRHVQLLRLLLLLA